MSSPDRPQIAWHRFSLAQLMALIFALALLLAIMRLIFAEDFGLLALAFVVLGFGGALFVLVTARSGKLAHALVILCIFGWLATLFLPAIQTCGWERRPACSNNLRQVAAAIASYEVHYGCLPPPFVADAQGKPMHSWRVLILPYLGELSLYDQYRFDEPWNGPNNRKLHDQIVDAYRCPSDHADRSRQSIPDTSYLVITGPGTVFPGGRQKISIADVAIGDGPSNTILVVEVHGSGIHWMEPRDIDFTTMDFQINGIKARSVSSQHPDGAMVAMVDSSVRFLDEKTPPQVVKQLITYKDAQPLPENLGVKSAD